MVIRPLFFNTLLHKLLNVEKYIIIVNINLTLLLWVSFIFVVEIN